jgi:dipeptidyl aminopeptidase/acylaminoacyl peptidase
MNSFGFAFLLIALFVTTMWSVPPVLAEDSVPVATIQDTALLKGPDGRITNLTALPIPGVRAYGMTYLSDGLTVAGFVIMPEDRTRKHPVMVYSRPGYRKLVAINAKALERLAFFARNGYIVLATQYRGGPGSQGQDRFGGDDIHDVINLITMAESLKQADSDRLFALGMSRGGLMTYMLLAATQKIRAAAVIGGMTDMVKHYFSRGDRLKQRLEGAFGAPASHDNPEYRNRSPLLWAEKIKTPVLIMHGAADTTAIPEHAQSMAEKLTRLGTTNRLKMFPNGSHLLREVVMQRDCMALQWFQQFGGPIVPAECHGREKEPIGRKK